MQLYTFKARSLAEAMRLVRDELGPDASVLHTREIGSPLARLVCGRMIEITASSEPCAPSRLPDANAILSERSFSGPSRPHVPAAELQNYRRKFRNDLLAKQMSGASLIEELAYRKLAPLPSSPA